MSSQKNIHQKVVQYTQQNSQQIDTQVVDVTSEVEKSYGQKIEDEYKHASVNLGKEEKDKILTLKMKLDNEITDAFSWKLLKANDYNIILAEALYKSKIQLQKQADEDEVQTEWISVGKKKKQNQGQTSSRRQQREGDQPQRRSNRKQRHERNLDELYRTLKKHDKYDERKEKLIQFYKEQEAKLEAKKRSASQDRAGYESGSGSRYADRDGDLKASRFQKRARSQSRRRFDDDGQNDTNRSSGNFTNDSPKEFKPLAPRKYVKKSDLLAAKNQPPKSAREVRQESRQQAVTYIKKQKTQNQESSANTQQQPTEQPEQAPTQQQQPAQTYQQSVPEQPQQTPQVQQTPQQPQQEAPKEQTKVEEKPAQQPQKQQDQPRYQKVQHQHQDQSQNTPQQQTQSPQQQQQTVQSSSQYAGSQNQVSAGSWRNQNKDSQQSNSNSGNQANRRERGQRNIDREERDFGVKDGSVIYNKKTDTSLQSVNVNDLTNNPGPIGRQKSNNQTQSQTSPSQVTQEKQPSSSSVNGGVIGSGSNNSNSYQVFGSGNSIINQVSQKQIQNNPQTTSQEAPSSFRSIRNIKFNETMECKLVDGELLIKGYYEDEQGRTIEIFIPYNQLQNQKK